MDGGQQQVLLVVHQEKGIVAGAEAQGRRLVVVEMSVTGEANQMLLVAVVEGEGEVVISDGIETLTGMNHASRHQEDMIYLRLHEVIVEVESGRDLEAGLAVLPGEGDDTIGCSLFNWRISSQYTYSAELTQPVIFHMHILRNQDSARGYLLNELKPDSCVHTTRLIWGPLTINSIMDFTLIKN